MEYEERKCCGELFASCWKPSCCNDEKWIKSAKEYIRIAEKQKWQSKWEISNDYSFDNPKLKESEFFIPFGSSGKLLK